MNIRAIRGSKNPQTLPKIFVVFVSFVVGHPPSTKHPIHPIHLRFTSLHRQVCPFPSHFFFTPVVDNEKSTLRNSDLPVGSSCASTTLEALLIRSLKINFPNPPQTKPLSLNALSCHTISEIYS